MLVISGLLTLLAIAHVGGDPIKGGFHAKGSSIAQEKVTQEEVIPSPFSTKSAAAFGTKVLTQKTAEAVSKTAQEPSLHHATKTSVKAQPSSGIHHAATSPVVQDQVIIDPALDSLRRVKTVKTTTNVRDPIARPVKSLAGPAVETKKIIKSLKTDFSSDDTQVRDPIALPVTQPIKTTKTRIVQEEAKLRDPIARPVLQTTKTSEDPSTSTKTIKTTTKANDASRFQSTKTSQEAVQYGIPESIVEASRRTSLRTSSVDTSANRQSSQMNNAEGLSINSDMGIMNEFGELILDEETLQTLRNAGGLLDQNGQIALNDIGIKLLQSMRSDNVLQKLPGSSDIAGPSVTLNTRTEISRRPESTASMSAVRTNDQRVRSQSRRRPSDVTVASLNNSPRRTSAGINSVISSTGSRTVASEELLNPVSYTGRVELNRIQTGSRISTDSARRGSVEAGASGVGQENPETVLFNGKEVRISGIRAGQLFDENLNPITSENTDILKSSVLAEADKPVIAPVFTSTRNSGVTGTTRTGGTETRRRTGAQTVRRIQNSQRVTSNVNLNSRGIAAGAGIAKPAQTSGTVLFNGKEIQINELREGQIFDENLQPIYSSNPSLETAVFPNAAGGQLNVNPVNNFGIRSGTVSSGSGISGSLTNSGIRQGSQRTSSIGLRTRQRKPVSSTPQTSGQGQLRTKPLDISPGVVTTTSGERFFQRISNVNTVPRGVLNAQMENVRGDITQVSRQNIQSSQPLSPSKPQVTAGEAIAPVSNNIAPVNPNTLNLGGLTSSEDSTFTGTVLFDGKEISIDGVKPGQLFDENLSPIPMQNLGAIDEKSTIIQSESPRTVIPSRNTVRTTGVRSSQSIQTTGLRSSTLATSGRGTSGALRISGMRSPEKVQSGVSSSQANSGIRSSSNSLTSGSVLFNGKEIAIDGLKAGQLFDENLQPISTGTSGAIAENSATFTGVSRVTGSQSSAVALTSGARSTQRTQTSNLRIPAQINSARGISRTSGTRISQSTAGQRSRSSVSSISSTQRVSQGTTATRSSGDSIASTAGIRSSSNSLTSGSALFNGKEIAINELKAGQLFDENLRPILSESQGATAENSARGVSRVSGIQSSGITQTSGVTSTLRTQTSSLRTPSQTSSARGTSRTSQLRSNQRLRSSVPGALTSQRASQGVTAIRSSGDSVTSSARTGSSSGSLTSGSVLFNGKEISIDGLKAGQLFDENLRPITTGTSSGIAEKSASLSGISRISGIRTNTASRVTGSTQQAQRSQTVRGTSTGQRASQGVTAIRSSGGSVTSSARTGSSSGSLTSGSVLFNGKEISIDGLKAGQLFDENLRPITTGTSSAVAEKSASLSGISRISGIRTNTASRVTGSTQQAQRSQTVRGTSTGQRASQGVTAIRSSGDSVTSNARTGSSSGSLTSGSVLFNGKEISIDGLKAGQLFDENLRPITTGTSSGIAEKSASLSGISRISGIRTNTASRVTGSTQQAQRSQTVRGTSTGQRASQGVTAIRSSGGSVTSSSRTGSSSGSLTSGSVLFNGKEISIDGLKAGQIFDENLRPITTGTSGGIAEKSASLSGISRISGVRTNTASRVTGSTQQAQRSQTVRGTSTGQRASQGVTAIRSSGGSVTSSARTGSSSGSLTSGSVLFNGKEISIDGLKAGQIFDENLRPITTGTSGGIAEKSASLSGISRISGIRTNTAARVTGLTQQAQRAQTNRLRSSPLSNSARVVTGTSRISDNRLTQSAPDLGVRSLTNTITSVRQTSRTPVASSLPSGSILFNGNEIPIDGLKAGQLFDENLRPINTGITGTVVEKSATLSDVSGISGVRSATVAGVTGSTTAQRSRGNTLRSSSLTNSARVVTGTSSTSDDKSTQSEPSLGFGSFPNNDSPSPNLQGVSGAAASGGSVPSGSVLFNGEEVSIDVLKAGFDANLPPVQFGTSDGNPETLPGVSGVSQISRSQSVSTGRTSTLRSQTGSLRSAGQSSAIRGITGSSRLSQSSPSLRTGSLSSRTTSTRRTQTNSGIPSLTSGTVLFNGKEISVDGLKAGQLFDENLQPILTETSGSRVSGIARTSGTTSTQRAQIGLRSSAPISGTSGLSGSRQSQSTSSLRSGLSSNSVSSAGRVSVTGTSTSAGLTSSQSSQSTGNLRAGSRIRNVPSTQSTSRTSGTTRLTGTSNAAGSFSSTNPSSVGNPQIIPTSNSLTSGTVLFNGKEIYMDGLKDGMMFDENLRPIVSGAAVLSSGSSDINPGSRSMASATNLRSGSTVLTASSSGASSGRGNVQGLRTEAVSSQSSSAARNSLDVIDVTRTDISSFPTGILAADSNTGATSSQAGTVSEISGGTVPIYASGFGSRGTNSRSKLNQKRINEDISGKPVVQEQTSFASDFQQKIQEPAVEQSLITKPEALRSVQVQEPVSFTVSNTPKTFATKISQVSQRDIDIPSVQQKLMNEEFSGYLPKSSFLPPFNYAVPQHAISGYNVKSPAIHQQQKIEQVFV